jgi:lipoyl(octanoyl) transferase
MTGAGELWVCRLGTVEYRKALTLQEQIRTARQSDAVPDTMLLLEHPRVYTRGRRSGADELTLPDEFYRAQGIEIVDVNRGGKITYHGPGQLVGYPIIAVDDVVEYVRSLERALVAALRQAGVAGARARPEDGPDYTGVWVQDRKIASIGVHVQRGVTTHGWAVNVDNDLTPFSWVVACGLDGVQMTSLAQEIDPTHPPPTHPSPLPAFSRRAVASIARELDRAPREVPLAELEAAMAAAPA